MHYSVANSDIKTRRNMMTFRAINCVNPLSVDVKQVLPLKWLVLIECCNLVLPWFHNSRVGDPQGKA